jgi:hypothetical protein
MGDTATVNQQVLEQQWLGGENFVTYITSKDKFDEIDKTATQLFKLAQDQMQALTSAFSVSVLFRLKARSGLRPELAQLFSRLLPHLRPLCFQGFCFLTHHCICSVGGCNISNELSTTIKTLYASRTTATLTDMEFDKMMNIYDKMINIDRKSVR